MNTIRLQARPSSFMSVPLPWEVLYEFGRMICLGVVVTFGPRPTHQAKHVPDLKDDALRIQIVLIKDRQATEPLTRELHGTTFGFR
jgi:hypothetical protein